MLKWDNGPTDFGCVQCPGCEDCRRKCERCPCTSGAATADKLPMGISEWRAHGDKFGYSVYFDDVRVRKGVQAWALMALKEDWFNERCWWIRLKTWYNWRFRNVYLRWHNEEEIAASIMGYNETVTNCHALKIEKDIKSH